MRKVCQFTVILVAALGLAGAARGGVLTSASILIPLEPYFDLSPITGTGAGSSVGLGATATLASNSLSGVVVASGVTTAPPITRVVISLTGHAGGNFTAGGGPGGGLGGPMTLAGTGKLVAYSGYVTLLTVPISPVGQPGGLASATAGGGTIVQVLGTGWTTGVRTLMVPATTVGGGIQTPITLTATGADLRTASGAGTLVLISPLFVRTNLAGDLPNFATLRLNYAPEPSTLLLVGLGIAGLALRGRRRR